MDALDAEIAFVLQYLEDARAGRGRSLEEYQALFPGWETAIAAEWERLGRSEAPPAGSFVAELTPRVIGRYQIVRHLGSGAQGSVYLAEDRELQRQVAIKVLNGTHALDAAALSRFRREAEIVAQLDHPGICSLLEFGTFEGITCIVMKYVEGETLAGCIAASRKGREGAGGGWAGLDLPTSSQGDAADAATLVLPGPREGVQRIVRFVETTARALHAAHEAGVVHRDIKPGNIIVTPSKAPVILDFGLARIRGADGPTLTQTGDRLGTPPYMSPEQFRGEPLDRSTDIWSLGVLLYECLTLERPFDAPTPSDLGRVIAREEPRSPRRRNPAVSLDLVAVTECALRKNRDRRYRSALDLAEDLRSVRDGDPVRVRRITPPERLMRWVRRRPAAAALMALVLLTLGLGTYLLVLWPEVRKSREAERRERVASLLEDGYIELREDNGPEALRWFSEARALDLGSAEAVAGIAWIHLDQAAPRDALIALDAAALESRYPDLGRLRVEALRALDREREAKELEDALGDPVSALGCFVAGLIEMRDGGAPGEDAYLRALDLFSQAALAAPEGISLYHFQMALAAGESGDARAAVRVAQAVTERWPGSAAAWYAAGYALSRTNVDSPRAIAAYREAIRLRPGFAVAHNNLGNTLKRLRDFEGAAAAYREAIRLRPDYARFHRNLAIIVARQGRLEEAIAILAHAVTLDPEDAQTHGSLAYFRVRQGDLPGAEAAYREALRVDPSCAAAWHDLGLLLVRVGRDAEALVAYREASRLEPGDPRPQIGLAMTSVRTGAYRQALGAARRAVELDPSRPDAHFFVGTALSKLGEDADAIEAYREALRLRPQHVQAAYNLGLALVRRRDHLAACEAFEASHRANPRDLAAHCNLAVALRETGRFDEALETAREALDAPSLNPDWRGKLEQLIRECEGNVVAAAALAAFQRTGDLPAGAEVPPLALVARIRGLYVTEVRLWMAALADATPATPMSARRVKAAHAALLAGLGKGPEAAELDAEQAAEWRDRAWTWFDAVLAANPPSPETLRALRLLTEDPELQELGVGTEGVPEREHDHWVELKEAIEALLRDS